jgi:hypothetical protein
VRGRVDIPIPNRRRCISTLEALHMRSWFAVICLLLSTALAYSQANGRLTGTVLDEFGQPVDGARVSTVVYSPGRSDAKDRARTDRTGQFQVDDMPMGTFGVTAQKIEEGYDGLADGTATPMVTITPEEPLASVIIKLGPKSGFLNPSVRDQATGKLIQKFTIGWFYSVPHGHVSGTDTFNHISDKLTCHPPRVNIPPTKEVSIIVTADGYKKWVGGPLKMQSGEERALSVDMQPEAKFTPTSP